MELIHWIHENMWMLNHQNGFRDMVFYTFFLMSIYVTLKSFTYPFFPKYGNLFYSITRRKNEKRRSFIAEFITGFTYVCIFIKPLILYSMSIIIVISLFEFFDSGRDQM